MHFDSRKVVCHGIKIIHAYLEIYPPTDWCQNKRFIKVPLYFHQKHYNAFALNEQEMG